MELNEPARGKYFDGVSARQHQVTVHRDHQHGTEVLVIRRDSGSDILWPVSELREVTDQARNEGIVLTQGQGGIARLILPHGPAEEIIRAISPNLGKVSVSRSKVRQLLLWAGGAVASVLIIMLVILPSLANQLATMIPPEREAALGRTALAQISSFLGGDLEEMTCDRPAGLKALRKMTARIVGESEVPYDLKVKVFDHDMINAFAVPGGQVMLFRGLIDAAQSPEEVAGVLGHEVGHVVHRDPTRLMLRSAGSVGILGMVFGDFAGGALALVLAEQMISAKYSQQAETGADVFAHERLAAAGLPADSFAQFFLTLKEEHGDSAGFMSHLASHPDLQGRANAARAADAIGDEAFTPVLTQSEWHALQQVCD